MNCVKFFLGALLALTPHVFAEETSELKTPEEKQVIEKDISVISESMGHLICKNLGTLGVDFDMEKIVKGIENSIKGVASPLSETTCIQSVTHIQEEAHKKLSTENLAKAESFLKKNAKTEGIVSLEPGKVQYKIVEQGKGTEVEKHFSPMISYVGKFLDGKVFGESEGSEVISLNETIPGFSQAIVGMREGEKRLIYVHPERGYGANAGYLPPNSLLCFEVTVKQANAEKKDDQTLSTAPQEGAQEVFTK